MSLLRNLFNFIGDQYQEKRQFWRIVKNLIAIMLAVSIQAITGNGTKAMLE